jgi:hypothetical protein
MKFPQTKTLGWVKGLDGEKYTLTFYGENEGAAVITGPLLVGGGEMRKVPEVHREPAHDPVDARTKLDAWRRAQG